MRNPVYSSECLYKHFRTAIENLHEVAEKLDELKFEKGKPYVDEIPEISNTIRAAYRLFIQMQRRLALLDTIKDEKERKLAEIKELKEAVATLLKIRYLIRTARRKLHGLRMKLLKDKDVDEKWIMDYFDEDFGSLMGNLDNIELHCSEIIDVYTARVSKMKKELLKDTRGNQ